VKKGQLLRDETFEKEREKTGQIVPIPHHKKPQNEL